MQDLDWFSAVTEMWAQGQGASCGLMTVCWGLEQREDPAWFEGVRDMGSGLFAGGLNKARNRLRVRRRLRSVGWGLEEVQDPAWFSAGTERWAQDRLPGA